jgi:hypothetical protein
MKFRILAAVAALSLGWAGCEQAPAAASTITGTAAGHRAAQASVIGCTKNGTLITCRYGTTGDVVAQLRDYANCPTEDSCGWQWVPGQGSGTGDYRWFLTGSNS